MIVLAVPTLMFSSLLIYLILFLYFTFILIFRRSGNMFITNRKYFQSLPCNGNRLRIMNTHVQLSSLVMKWTRSAQETPGLSLLFLFLGLGSFGIKVIPGFSSGVTRTSLQLIMSPFVYRNILKSPHQLLFFKYF